MKEKDRLSALRQTTSVVPGEEEAKELKKEKRAANEVVAHSPYAKKLLQAGISLPPRIWVVFSLAAAFVAALVSATLGMIFCVAMGLFVAQFLLVGYLDERATKRKRKVIPQLAPFIDGLASALATGFNIEAAIVQATEGTPPGVLRTELDRVVRGLDRGLSVRESMAMLKDRIAGKEITSLVVSLSLFSSMGGHVLEPFRRLARKIREQQSLLDKANRDLVMVKQAFYILFFLTMAAPLVIVLVQPSYLKDAFTDTLGRIVLQIGAIMVLGAYVFFKHITNLKL